MKMAINTYQLIITLNINGLKAPVKRHREADGKRGKGERFSRERKGIIDTAKSFKEDSDRLTPRCIIIKQNGQS